MLVWIPVLPAFNITLTPMKHHLDLDDQELVVKVSARSVSILKMETKSFRMVCTEMVHMQQLCSGDKNQRSYMPKP